jgi:hypothetical protein
MVKEEVKTFSDWLKSIPYLEYAKTLKEIESKTFVSRITVYNWRVGNHNVPRYAQQIIMQIAEQELLFPKVKTAKSKAAKNQRVTSSI